VDATRHNCQEPDPPATANFGNSLPAINLIDFRYEKKSKKVKENLLRKFFTFGGISFIHTEPDWWPARCHGDMPYQGFFRH
jgi:hypothetical protein